MLHFLSTLDNRQEHAGCKGLTAAAGLAGVMYVQVSDEIQPHHSQPLRETTDLQNIFNQGDHMYHTSDYLFPFLMSFNVTGLYLPGKNKGIHFCYGKTNSFIPKDKVK
jgi:hypothetical protein